jgi:hypothetical protein
MTTIKLHPLFLVAVVVASTVLLLAIPAVDASAAIKYCYPNCPGRPRPTSGRVAASAATSYTVPERTRRPALGGECLSACDHRPWLP